MKKILLFLVLSISSFSIFGQQIQIYQQFNGRYNYTAIGNTLNQSENQNPSCTILTENSATLTLGSGQTLVSAKLYWSGSALGDFDVKLNGNDITAQRTFSLVYSGLPYFAAYADVTSIVEANGNGTYTFSDMDITATLQNYCTGGTNYGGWSIIIIYEDPALLWTQVSLFDGLEAVSSTQNSLDIILTNIDVVSDVLSKIGFLAWEGDAAIANGESLKINNNIVGNLPLNPPNNAFNSTNSYTNSSSLYNMDLDFYDLMGLIQPGDTNIAIQLTSQQDFIIVNNIIVAVNSELPDPTIVIDGAVAFPQQDQIQITYTVSNTNSTAELPANTPITFYANGIEFGETQTNQIVPIGGTLTEVATIALPTGTPSNFTLKATINADGTIPETDGTNNDYELQLTISPITVNETPEALQVCDTDNDGFAQFTLHNADADITLGDPSLTTTYHFTLLDAENGLNELQDPYINNNPFTDEVFARIVNADGSSFAVVTLPLIVNEQPPIIAPITLFINEGDGDGFAIFDLTVKIPEILNGLNPSDYAVLFYETLADAENNVNPIANPSAYGNVTNPQTIYVRVENLNSGCYAITSFEIETDRTISVDSFTFEDLSITPNPTSESFTVQSSQLISETTILLYDIQGKKLFSEKILPQNGKLTMEVSSFENGIYFVKISSEGNTVIKKLIKN